MRGLSAMVLIVALGMAALAPPARADGGDAASAVAQRVAAEMVEAGYTDVAVDWTWLGRLRVTGWIEGREREIILHPTSGEVLRDFLAPPAVHTVTSDENADMADTVASAAAEGGTLGVARIGDEPVALGGVDAAAVAAGAGGP